ncbi:hypothetical protein [Escherichia coli]|uniref:hypothetical protein n=1 Tax=Escherichia coli TaxID=562 RepID=UPI003EEA580A
MPILELEANVGWGTVASGLMDGLLQEPVGWAPSGILIDTGQAAAVEAAAAGWGSATCLLVIITKCCPELVE